MKVTPIAADSLGTRSMATFVEADDCNVFIDPSVRLAPKRYGRTPHRLEKERQKEHWNTIKECVKRCQVLVITHYHFDHHNPDAPSIYRGKTVLLKNPEEKINRNQKTRAKSFISKVGRYAREIHHADKDEFRFGSTVIEFSKPVQHGPTLRMGWVVEVAIRSGKKTFVHTSDVQGASERAQLEFVLDSDPDVVLMDGPFSMLMMMDKARPLKRSEKNIIRIIEETKVKDFLIDHHFLRELEYRERIPGIFKAAKRNKVNLTTCAGYLGKQEELLEARRKELYKADEG